MPIHSPLLTPKQREDVLNHVKALVEKNDIRMIRDYSEITSRLPKIAAIYQEATAHARRRDQVRNHSLRCGEELTQLGIQLLVLAQVLSTDNSDDNS